MLYGENILMMITPFSN